MKLGKVTQALVLGSLAACSTLVGADFDDKREPDALGGGGTTGRAGSISAGAGGVAGDNRAGVGGGGTSSAGTPQDAGAGGDVASAGAGGDARGEGGSGEGGAAGTPEGGSGGAQPGGGTAGLGGGSGNGGGGKGGSVVVEGGAGGAAAGAGGMGQDAVVVINEVKGQGSGDDYIELYNRGPGPFDLSGYRVSDQNNTFAFPNGAELDEGAYLLLLLGQVDTGGPFLCFTPNACYHDTWGISAGGENVFFRDPSGQQLDTTLYPNETAPGGLTNTQTWGRFPNGTGTFRATRPTPEVANLTP